MDNEARRVRRAIALALALIAEQDPELARLLSKSIKTGQYLSYSSASPPDLRRKSQRAEKTPQRRGKTVATRHKVIVNALFCFRQSARLLPPIFPSER
jgi:hypothetical protein